GRGCGDGIAGLHGPEPGSATRARERHVAQAQAQLLRAEHALHLEAEGLPVENERAEVVGSLERLPSFADQQILQRISIERLPQRLLREEKRPDHAAAVPRGIGAAQGRELGRAERPEHEGDVHVGMGGMELSRRGAPIERRPEQIGARFPARDLHRAARRGAGVEGPRPHQNPPLAPPPPLLPPPKPPNPPPPPPPNPPPSPPPIPPKPPNIPP